MTEGAIISEFMGSLEIEKKHTTQYVGYSTSISLIIITDKPSQLIIP